VALLGSGDYMMKCAGDCMALFKVGYRPFPGEAKEIHEECQ
jgi:hypothetical protein